MTFAATPPATCFGRCVKVSACSEMGSCRFGCLDPKLPRCEEPKVKMIPSRKRRVAKVRSDSLYLLRFVLGGDMSADEAIKCLTRLTKLAQKAP